MQLLQKVQRYIDENDLMPVNATVIVGLSGGRDSMALLSVLTGLGYNCIAAHCNFHLRGEESDRDEKFVTDYCAGQNIKLVKVSFDTFSYMEEKSISLEMAARELRYNWFEKMKEEHAAHYIAVAHHRDDSVETVLINLMRGTGIRGLTGIPPKNGYIVRPLLCLSREEITEYLSVHKIHYVEDSTNTEDQYTRNKLRLNIIPLMEEINPSFKNSVSRTSAILSEVERIYTSVVKEEVDRLFDGEKIDIPKLKESENVKAILFEILHPYGFNADTILNIYNSLNALSGKCFYSSTFCLLKDRNFFILSPLSDKAVLKYVISEDENNIAKPLKLNLKTIAVDNNFTIVKDKNILYADKSLVRFPLYIRKWEQGDKFYPFGMKGRKKKVSDYFTDRKKNLLEKENTWLLCDSDNQIIWIIGERTDDRFKITDKTTQILIIESEEN